MSNSKSKLYTCPVCGFSYWEKRWADKCKRWCLKHKSCNLDIIKHGIAGKNTK